MSLSSINALSRHTSERLRGPEHASEFGGGVEGVPDSPVRVESDLPLTCSRSASTDHDVSEAMRPIAPLADDQVC